MAHHQEAANALIAPILNHPGEDQMQPGNAAARDPGLAAIDHPNIAMAHRARRHFCRGRTGFGFRDQNRGLIASKHQISGDALLGIRPIGHDGANRAHIGFNGDAATNGTGFGKFLDHQGSVEVIPARPAPGTRHGQAGEARFRHAPYHGPRIGAGAISLGSLGCRFARQFARSVAQPCLFWGQAIHDFGLK